MKSKSVDVCMVSVPVNTEGHSLSYYFRILQVAIKCPENCFLIYYFHIDKYC